MYGRGRERREESPVTHHDGTSRGAIAFTLTLLALVSACADNRSTYVRTAASPRELVWGYDGGLQVSQAGRPIAETGDWDGLAPAVRCVSQAEVWAESASSRDTAGKVLIWTGFAVMTAATIGGAALALSDTDDTSQMLTGLGIIGGGLVVGLGTVPTGAYYRATAETRAIDSVNRYNDEVWAGGCAR
jgi:hypothetical protein